MKLKKPLLYAVIAGVNALSLTAALALTLTGGTIARSQSYNRSAEKWDRDGESTQISCFFAEGAGFTTDSVYALRAEMQSKLSSAINNPNGKLPETPDAYSTPIGTGYVTADSIKNAEADITAIGGDFFLFRDFKRLSGAYFTEDDLMQDGAVIERSLAWKLYGSPNVAGQQIYIDGTQFYIAAVIDDPTDKYEKLTADENPRVYVSLTKITCYECIMYDPVENFAYNTVNKYLKNMYNGRYSAVNNTERFKPSRMAKAYKKRPLLAVRRDTLVYPYWENASRIAEFKLAPMYFWRTVCFVLPIITAIWLIWQGSRLVKRNGLKLISAVIEAYKKAVYRRRQKKANI